MTKRELILQAITDKVNTARPADVPQASRWRGFDQPSTVVRSITIRPHKEEIEKGPGPGGGGVVRRTLVVAIECRVAGSAVSGPDATLDPILEWIPRQLNGSRLGGLVREVLEAEILWEGAQADRAYVMATVYVVAHYLTLLADATVTP